MIRIIKKIKKQNPKIVVHTHSTKAGLLGRWAALFAGVKNRIHTVHGFGFHDHQSKLAWIITYVLEFITAPITTHYICVSEKDLQRGSKILPTFKKKCSIIRAATNSDVFFIPAKKIIPTEKVITIGTVSCFKPQKNLLDLLKAFKYACDLVSSRELRLQIIGDGKMRPEIETWVKVNKMQNKILLIGWQDNVAQFMHQWDVFAMSSLWEGLPMAVVEARFSKLPVIAYNVGGIYEVVKNNQNGFLINPGKWQDLGEKIACVVTDDNLRQQLSNFKDNISDFENSSMIFQHLKLYQRLV
jgi:glycosyltransferase involved in cell wall biosynthesis